MLIRVKKVVLPRKKPPPVLRLLLATIMLIIKTPNAKFGICAIGFTQYKIDHLLYYVNR